MRDNHLITLHTNIHLPHPSPSNQIIINNYLLLLSSIIVGNVYTN